MSKKQHTNLGKFNFITGNKQYAEGEYEKAIKSFTNAVDEYSKIDEDNNAIQILSKAYLNLAASHIAQDEPSKAIEILLEALNKGLDSADFKKNLAVAYYNLGLQQINSASGVNNGLKRAINSFETAKTIYLDDANILYNLGVALILDNEHNKSKEEFMELFAKGLSEEQFPLKLQLNAYCKLVECQLKLSENTTGTLEKASEVLSKLNLAEHQEETAFICSHLAAKYLAEGKPEQVKANIEVTKAANVTMPEKIATDLEQYVLSMYNSAVDKDGKKNATKMLLTLAHVKEVFSTMLLENIKEQLASISDHLATEKSYDFSVKVLGAIDSCNYYDVEDLFALDS